LGDIDIGRLLPFLACADVIYCILCSSGLSALSYAIPATDWEVGFLSHPIVQLVVPSGVIILVMGVTAYVGWKYNQDSRSFARRMEET
jgi:heme/copper-type cytochrome/quinol oxidase subunit 2